MTKLSWLWLLFHPAACLRNSLWGCTSIMEIKLNKALWTVSETEHDIYSLKIQFKTCFCLYPFLTCQQHVAPILATVRFLYNLVYCKGSRHLHPTALSDFWLCSSRLNIYKFSQPELELELPKEYKTMPCPIWTLKWGDPSPLHSTGEAPSGVLDPVLVSSEQQRHGHTGASCVKGHKDDERKYEGWLNQLGLFS